MTSTPRARTVGIVRYWRSFRIPILLAVAVLIGNLLAAALGQGGSIARGSSVQDAASQETVDSVLGQVDPGARGRIREDHTLQIVLPPGSGGPEPADYTPVWRASLAASELALRLPQLRRWTVSDGPPETLRSARHPSAAGRLDSLSLNAASDQLAANLRVLRLGVPASAHLQVTDTTTVPLAIPSRRFAFLVDLHVRNLRALHKHFGDLVLGPGTGLINPQRLIDGLAVRVTDNHGQSLAFWAAARGDGAVNYGPGNGCLAVTFPFHDARGRPPGGVCHG